MEEDAPVIENAPAPAKDPGDTESAEVAQVADEKPSKPSLRIQSSDGKEFDISHKALMLCNTISQMMQGG